MTPLDSCLRSAMPNDVWWLDWRLRLTYSAIAQSPITAMTRGAVSLTLRPADSDNVLIAIYPSTQKLTE